MNLATASHYAEVLTDQWFKVYAERYQVAGSIRRNRPVCNDVDIVCIPKVVEHRDLFGEVTGRENLLHVFLKAYVAGSQARCHFLSGGEMVGKSIILQLAKCQLDIWFADETTFATRLMCRTGSKEHNIWLAQRAKSLGRKWNPYEGILFGGTWNPVDGENVYEGGELCHFQTEEELYGALDLPFIEPGNRELDWLVKHFGQ